VFLAKMLSKPVWRDSKCEAAYLLTTQKTVIISGHPLIRQL